MSMESLSAKEFIIGLLICILAFFGGRVTKQCAKIDIAEIQEQSKKLEQELNESKTIIDDLANAYAEQTLINSELKENPSVITKWKERIIKVPADNCNGVIGSDEANKFNQVAAEIEARMLP